MHVEGLVYVVVLWKHVYVVPMRMRNILMKYHGSHLIVSLQRSVIGVNTLYE